MRTAAIRFSCLALAAGAVLAVQAQPANRGAAPAQPDYSKVEIKTTQVAPNFYTLDGQGGTIGILVGPDGVFQVDAQFAPLSEKIATAIRAVSNGRFRFLVNTHVHGDHTGGDENFAKLGATILARTELRERLAQAAGATPAGLPMVTYDGPVTLHMNGETIELIPIPHAHTDGDTLVHFVNADVLMTGDYYRSLGYPNIDRANGGSLDGMLRGLARTIAMAGPNTKIIPGHGAMVDRNAVAAQRDMMLVIRDRVAKLIQQGKTQEEVLAAKVTADYDSKVTGVGTTGDRFIGQLYAELKTPK
ncbi:MAG: MBL fold metallo-hydrolase [Acidobacteriia bacterium]|nr:MBL fold metallo-hydrolase [Terriglobia bacterium]